MENYKRVALFNPLSSDFSYEWLDDENKKHTLTMNSREITYFPEPQAKFMMKHLADAIIHQRGVRTNHEDEYKAILKEIQVEI